MRSVKPNQIDMWTAASRAKYTAEIEALKPIARQLADEAGEQGVTVADLRLAGVERGLIPETSKGRQLSYLGSVMRAAGLVATGIVRRSNIERSHGNRHTVWRAPTHNRAEAA